MLDLQLPQTEHCLSFTAPQAAVPHILTWLDDHCPGRANFSPIEPLFLFSDWDMDFDVWFESDNDALMFDLMFRGSTYETVKHFV
jgi:hypothetical protein